MRAFLAALACAASLAGPALADTIVDNVSGITLDDKGAVVRFTGLVFDKDGHITQVLQKGDKRPKKLDYAVDGKGRVMIPGLIDAHGHVLAIGLGQVTLDLSGTRSLAEAQAKITAYAAANPDRPWILGRGWNQEAWGLGRFPTAAELDAALADRPVWLERVDGHAGWANTAALTAGTVTPDTKDPVGGRIERAAGGKPAGVLVDAAMSLIAAKVPPPRPVDRDVALREAQKLLIAQGFTAVADMGTTLDDWQSLRRAGDEGALRIRIIAYAAGTDAMLLIGGPGPTQWLYDDRLRLNGVRLVLDGALGSRGAALKAPYADDPGNTGLTLISDTQLSNLMSRAAYDKFQVAVDATGDRANAMVLNAIDELVQTYDGDRRWRIEHAQVVDPADIARFGRNGIIASMQPQQQASDRLMAEARLGPARMAGAYAWKSLVTAGATLAFGDDAPAEPPAPFVALAVAITREDADAQPAGGWQPQERLTPEQAFAAYTTGAARAAFAETRIGRLAKGLHADFVLIDQDPLTATPAQLRATKVLETWINGQMAYRAGATAQPKPH